MPWRRILILVLFAAIIVGLLFLGLSFMGNARGNGLSYAIGLGLIGLGASLAGQTLKSYLDNRRARRK